MDNIDNIIKDTGYVYKWTNKFTNKWYIGSHKSDNINDNYIGSGLLFRLAYKKYGIESFEKEILYFGENYRDEEERILIELDAANNDLSYNMKNEACGGAFYGEKNGMYKKQHTEETKKLMSKASSDRWKDPEYKRIHTEMLKGKGNPMFGKNRKGTFAAKKISETKLAKYKDWFFLKTAKHHKTQFAKIYQKLLKNGEFVEPRGQNVLEAENFSYELSPYVRFHNFENRKLNLKYIKNEFLWYLKGDKYDLSICKHAKLWNDIKNKDGSINSNYGQYIFGDINQFDNVVNILACDRDSRRGSIIILDRNHLFEETNDVPCTYSINFRIRQNKLNMTVHMRSQDAIYGMGNDTPTFSFIHEMMLNALKVFYSELEYGTYYHFVDSFHVYERHFEMFKQLVKGDCYALIYCPKISGPEEVSFLRKLDFSSIPENFEFSKWLIKQ